MMGKSNKEEQMRVEQQLGLKARLHPTFDALPDDAVLNPDDIAGLLRVSTETVRRWCRSGKIENYSFGGKFVVMGSDFKEFLRRHKSRTKVERQLLKNE